MGITLGAASVALAPHLLAEPVAARARIFALCAAGLPVARAAGARGSGLGDGLGPAALNALDALFATATPVKKRAVFHRAMAPFTALHAIRMGTFKTLVRTEDGREQIVGYHMAGDLLGLDGIGGERHSCEAVALEDSVVSALPFARLDDLARLEPALHRNVHRLLATNLEHGRHMMLLLGSLSAEERLAAFLLDLAERLRKGGFSAHEFMLRMTREEIASFLGLKLETVSRVFSRLHGEGVLQVQGRAIKLLDVAALRLLAGYPAESPARAQTHDA